MQALEGKYSACTDDDDGGDGDCDGNGARQKGERGTERVVFIARLCHATISNESFNTSKTIRKVSLA